MKRIAALSLLAIMLISLGGCALLDTIAIDVAVTQFTKGWKNQLTDPLLTVFAEQVTIDGMTMTRQEAADYMANPNWWNSIEPPTFVAGMPDIVDDNATTTIDFTWQGTAVLVNLGLTRATGRWKINSVAIHDDWRN